MEVGGNEEQDKEANKTRWKGKKNKKTKKLNVGLRKSGEIWITGPG